MKPAPSLPSPAAANDPDIVEQALPGHGVPSQDPALAAQVGLSVADAEREAKSIFVGGGVVAGLATGAVAGAAVAGPVGILVGASVGAVAGVVGSYAAAELVVPETVTQSEAELADAEQAERAVAPR